MSTTTTSEAGGTGRRAGLDRDDIVERALEMVEEGGVGALTMRKLAAELGVTTTTIYWHVGDRDELVSSIIERVAHRQAELSVEGPSPRDRVMCVARHVWRSALAHRNVTALAHQVGATSLLELPLEKALARELDAAGVHGDAARDALRAILMCVAGFLVVAFRSDGRGANGIRNQPHTLWADVVDDSIAPATLAAMRVPPQLDPLFETTVRAVVDSFVPAPNDPPRRSATTRSTP